MRVQNFSQKQTFPYIWKCQSRSSSIKLVNQCYLEEQQSKLKSKSLDKIQSQSLVYSPNNQDKQQFPLGLSAINNRQQKNLLQQKQKENNIVDSLKSKRFCNNLRKKFQYQQCKTLNSQKIEKGYEKLYLFPIKSLPNLHESSISQQYYNNGITQSLDIIEENNHQTKNFGKSKSISNRLLNQNKQLLSIKSYQLSNTPISANNYNRIKKQQKYPIKVEKKRKKIKKIPYLLKCDVSLSIQSYEKKLSNKLGTFSDSFNFTPRNQHQEPQNDPYVLSPGILFKFQSEKIVQNSNESFSQDSISFENKTAKKENNQKQQQNIIELICFSDSENNKSNDLKQQNKIFENGDSDIEFEKKVALNMCEICRQYNELVTYQPCIHKFCKECYVDYLQDKIKYAEVVNITCPSCEQIIPEDIIKYLVTFEYFEKYKKYKYAQEVDQDPTRKWCPKPGCHNVISKNNWSNVALCECGSKVCFLCGNLAHGDQSCQSVLNQQFQLAVRNYSIKPCPNCKSPIEKISGCNHMNCTKCKFQFCWICLQKYHQYHYRYWSIKGCAVWSNGRYKRNINMANPDLRRHIFLVPRLIIFIIRGPLIILKLFFKASYEAIKQPYVQIMKNTKQSIRGMNVCLKFCVMFIMMYIAFIISILFYPLTLICYSLPEEIHMMRIKGCAY